MLDVDFREGRLAEVRILGILRSWLELSAAAKHSLYLRTS
jgi:hypothetical protein